MLKKILLAFAIMMVAVRTSAQIVLEPSAIKVYTLRMEDRLNGGVRLEQTRYDERTRTSTVYDLKTGERILVITETPDFKSAVTVHPFGSATFTSAFPPRFLKPGQQTTGFVDLEQNGLPPLRLASTIRVTRKANFDVVEMSASGAGHSLWTQAFFQPGERVIPEQMETVYHINGQKVNHLRGHRVTH